MIWKIVFAVLAVGMLVEAEYSEICRSNSRGDIGQEIESKANQASICMVVLVDMGELRKDFLDALPINSFTSAAKKYCPKASRLKACLKELVNRPDPCLPQFVLNNVILFNNASKIVLDLICYNDAEIMNSFSADGGFQCFYNKSEALNDCLSHVTEAPPDNSLSSHAEHCRIMNVIETCVTSALYNCPTPAAGNLAKPFFAIARKAHSCP